MLKHFEGARLGLFVFLGTILLIISIFMIGNKESLFVDTINIKTVFSRVEGLKSGAPVRLSGYDIGSVSNIMLANDTTGNVIVTMNIEEDVKHFIRLDSEASIETEGLVGKKIVSITPGSKDMEMISEGSFIKSKPPVNIAEIVEETQSIMAYVKDLTKDFSEIVAKVNHGEGTIGKLINDDALYKSSVRITQSADTSLGVITSKLNEVGGSLVKIGYGAESVFAKIDSAINNIKNLTARVERGEGLLGSLITDQTAYDSLKAAINNLTQTTEATSYGAKSFAENMEALKHNWLFKSYFEERGYWNRSDYEKELDRKLEALKEQNNLLDTKIKELKSLGVTLPDSASSSN